MGTRARAAIGAAAIGLATASAGPADTRPADTRPADTRPADTRPADTYPVRLSVPAHVGDVSKVSTHLKRSYSQAWTAGGNGRPPVAYTFEAALDATETVGAVSAKGRPTKLTIAVGRCTKDGVPLLPAGTTIGAETVDGRVALTINGQVPTGDVKLALGELVRTARTDEPTADDEFGTDVPRRVGDSWLANADQLADATRLPFHVTGRDFTGRATLTGVSAADRTETVDLTQHCAFDSRPTPDAAAVKGMRMDREFTLVVPTDAAAHGSHSTQHFKVAYTVVRPTESAEFRAEDTVETTYSAFGK